MKNYFLFFVLLVGVQVILYDELSAKSIIFISYSLSFIGLVLGIIYGEVLPKKPIKISDNVIDDLTHSKQIESYNNHIKNIKNKTIKKIKFSIGYLFIFPSLFLIIELGIENLWWFEFNVKNIKTILWCFYLMASFYYIDCLTYLVGYVKQSKI